jgi:hypothetical protein
MGGIFLDTGKNIWIQKSSRVIKGLIVSYLVSGAGLLLLALLLLKYQLDERKVSAGILAVYILSGLSGGIYMGKNSRKKKISVGNDTWQYILGYSDAAYHLFRCRYGIGGKRCISYTSYLCRVVNFGSNGDGSLKTVADREK